MWLLLPPLPVLATQAWRMAVLAALDALEYGRWFLLGSCCSCAPVRVFSEQGQGRGSAGRFWFDLQGLAAGPGALAHEWAGEVLDGFFQLVDGRLKAMAAWGRRQAQIDWGICSWVARQL